MRKICATVFGVLFMFLVFCLFYCYREKQTFNFQNNEGVKSLVLESKMSPRGEYLKETNIEELFSRPGQWQIVAFDNNEIKLGLLKYFTDGKVRFAEKNMGSVFQKIDAENISITGNKVSVVVSKNWGVAFALSFVVLCVGFFVCTFVLNVRY